jgi:hypothetical protein
MPAKWIAAAFFTLVVLLCGCAASSGPPQFSDRPSTGQITAARIFLAHQSKTVPDIPAGQTQADWTRAIVVRQTVGNGGWLALVLLPNGTLSNISSSEEDGQIIALKVSPGDYIAYYWHSLDSGLRFDDVRLLRQQAVSMPLSTPAASVCS